jgi:Zn-dependent protease with chaperone function
MIDRSFDRNQETNADEYALSLVQKVYGHAWGAEEFFVAVQAKESDVESSFNRFVSTHPLTDARIARIRSAQAGAPADLKLPERRFSEWVSEFDCTTEE